MSMVPPEARLTGRNGIGTISLPASPLGTQDAEVSIDESQTHEDIGGTAFDGSCQNDSDHDEFLSARSGSFDSSRPALSSFEQLPSELVDAIFEYLSPLDLTVVRQVSKALYVHANNDYHWQRRVQSNIPGNTVTRSYPFDTFRELYACHDPFWFIPRHKLWFSDHGLAGELIIVQYDQRRGVIEGYQLVAVSQNETTEPWAAHGDLIVNVNHFNPEVKLHRDKPVLKISPGDRQSRNEKNSPSSSPRREFFPAQPMSLDVDIDPRVGEVVLAKPLASVLEDNIPNTFPYGYAWPPPTIPARHRVGAQAAGVLPISSQRLEVASPGNWAPSSRSEASDQTFRIRRWMEWIRSGLGLRLGEETVTWSTLDPYYYTPTKEKPWRGIFVGDYNLHGCEYLLVHQPDSGEDEEPLERQEGETDGEFEHRFLHEKVYSGSIEAVKLTGDTNVPRGEYSFVAPDLGDRGLVCIEEEAPFDGCRVVRSRGHIAADGFVNDTYMPTQLILVSHDRLAQFWMGFRHVSYYQRVDIDRFLVP